MLSCNTNLYFCQANLDCKKLHLPRKGATRFYKFGRFDQNQTVIKVEKISKGSLDSIPSPSPSVKIQIMGGKVCLRCKGKTLLGDVNKLFVFKSLLTTPSNVLPLHLKQTFPPIIWIFTKGEGDGIESRLSFKIFSTLIFQHTYSKKCQMWL